MDRVDSHQHYWQPLRGDYGWMPMDDPVLARQYRPADLEPSLDRHGIRSTVLVQAAPTIEETEYLLGIADATDSVAGVVGWVDFESPDSPRHLERLAGHPKFKGVRPMIQDIPDVDWMLRDGLRRSFDAVVDLDLTFDALGHPRHLANFHALLTRHPDMRIVVDHCMKPLIRDRAFDDWAEGMSALARNTNARVKLSGLVTECGEDWSVEELRPYVDRVLELFGVDRIMWGSDWPVCLLRSSYDRWLEAAEALTRQLTPPEKERMFGGTATEFYRLKP